MALSTVLSSISYWDNSDSSLNWELSGAHSAGQFAISATTSTEFREDFEHYITTLYNNSPTMRALLELEAAAGEIRVAQSVSEPAFSSLNTPGPLDPPSPDYKGFTAFNFDVIPQIGDFNDHGQWVANLAELVISHEFAHQYNLASDPDPLVIDENDPNFDHKGEAVKFQNDVALELGYDDAIRSSYLSSRNISEFSLWGDYTNGMKIDISRVGRQIGTITLDTSTRTDSSRDLIVGLGAAEVIKTGGGNDFLYGGAGADVLDAGSGDDFLVGGSDSDTMRGGPGNDEIWGGDVGQETSAGIDIVDYSDAAKRIKIVVGQDSLIVHDGDGGMDTLYAINEIKGTQKRDLLTVVGSISTSTDALTIDANGGQGANPSDTINLSAMTSQTLLSIDENGDGSILDLDTTGVISLKGFHTSILGSSNDDTISDEASGPKRISGNEGNDAIIATGGSAYIDGGVGDDVITGGNYNDVLIGGSGGDTLNGGAGSDYLIANMEMQIGQAADLLYGGDGHDYLAHGHFMEGGTGNDIIDARGAYHDPAHNYGAVVKFSSGDGHDTIIDDGFQATPGTSNGEIIDPVDGVGKIDFGSLLKSDVNLIWDASFVLTGSSGGTSYYDAIGNLAVVILATGDSVLFQNVAGTVISQNGIPTSGRIYALEIGIPSMEFADGNLQNIGDGILNVQLSHGSTTAYETAPNDWISSTQSGPIDGTSGDDNLTGGNGDDVISAGNGNDEVSLSGGNDTIDGGQGSDSLSFFGSIEGFQLQQITSGIRLISSSGLEGVAEVVGVESFYSITDDRTWSFAQMLGRISTTGNDAMIGTDDDDVLFADAGDDSMTGLGGNDALDGGDGVDQAIYSGNAADYILAVSPATSFMVIDLVGNDGVDRLDNVESIYFQGDQTSVLTNSVTAITGTSGGDWLIGTSAADTVYGLEGDDDIFASGGNDVISAGDGSNQIDGGSGIDTAFYSGPSSDYTVYKNLSGDMKVAGVSSDLNDTLVDVERIYFEGDGVLRQTSEIPSPTTPGDDVIYGSEEDDTIFADDGDDYIHAGKGENIIDGGNGNDTADYDGSSSEYWVYRNDDGSVAVEKYYTPYDVYDELVNVENLHFSGDDILFSLSQLPGPGGSGDDSISGTIFHDWLRGGDGNDEITGEGGDDELDGENGDDHLNGGVGSDWMVGGDGNDFYIVDNAGDIIVEGVDEGWDGVESTVSYTLPGDVEGLYLGGADPINGTGNDLDNEIYGNDYANVLTGMGGGDYIVGSYGNDRLIGGAGDDLLAGESGSADVAVYAGLQSSFTVATINGTVTITDNAPTVDGDEGVDSLFGIEVVEFQGSVQTGISSPIVLDLNGNGVSLVDNKRTKASFDWDGDGVRNQTGWIGKDDGFLFIDRDGNGTVTNSGELSFTSDKKDAKSDLDGLRAFDSNDDGILSSGDDRFSQFKIWRDKNGNGRVDKKEILSLEVAGVASLNLEGEAVNQTWGWGRNITVNNGTFTRTNGTTADFADVAISYDRPSTSSRSLSRDFWTGDRFQRVDVQKAASQLSEALAAFGNGSGIGDISLHDGWADRRDHVFAASHSVTN